MNRKRIIQIALIAAILLGLLLIGLAMCRHPGSAPENTGSDPTSQPNETLASGIANFSAQGEATSAPDNVTPTPDKSTPAPGDGNENSDTPAGNGTAEPENTKNESPEKETPGAAVTGTPENAAPGTRTPKPEPSSGGLKVAGTQLCDAAGKPVQLRGVSTHGLAWYPDYVNKSCFKELRDSWNVNVIRLAMYTAEYGGYCTGGDQTALKNLVSRGVDYATELNMYVIIDWHILSDGNPNTYKSEAIAFFGEMSKKYAGHDNILYEICNEPNGGTSWQDIKAYAMEVIPVIRANDPDAVILVGTPNWCQYVDQAAADPITGYDNIMYTLHFYADTHREDLRDKMERAIRAGLPVFVSEYGICDASGNGPINKEESALWISTMDRLGVSYVAWNLSNKGETAALLQPSCTKQSGFDSGDLSEAGHWIYEMLTGEHMTPNPTAEGKTPAQTATATPAPAPTQTPAPDITVSPDWSARLVNSWESGGMTYYQYTLTLTNNTGTSCTKWEIKIEFEGPVTVSDGWNGDYSVNGNLLRIVSKNYNGAIPAGGSISDIGFIVCGAGRIK